MSIPSTIQPGPDWLEIRDLGRVGYADTLSLQRSLQQEVQEFDEAIEKSHHHQSDAAPGTSREPGEGTGTEKS